MMNNKTFKRIQNYQYRCTDNSCMLAGFKFYVGFYYPLIPKSWTANWISILSSLLLGVAFFISYFQWWANSALMVAVLVHFYVVGDHLDGMRAKQMKSSSALGEFTDHFLDLFNTCLVTASVLNFVPLSREAYLALVCLVCAAYIATFVEQLEKGWLYFRYLGSLEGNILLIAFLISLSFAETFWLSPWFFGLGGYFLLILLSAVGSLCTICIIFWSLPKPSWPLVHYLIISSWLAFLAARSYSNINLGLVCLSFYAAHYAAQLFFSYFTQTKHQHPNIRFSVLLVFSFSMSVWWPGQTEIIFYALTLFSVFLAIQSMFRVLKVLGQPVQPN